MCAGSHHLNDISPAKHYSRRCRWRRHSALSSIFLEKHRTVPNDFNFVQIYVTIVTSDTSFLFMTVFVYKSSCVYVTLVQICFRSRLVTKLPGYSCKHFGIPGKHFPSKGNRIVFSVAFDVNLSELALRSVSCDYMVLSSSHLLYVLLFRNTLCFLDLN